MNLLSTDLFTKHLISIFMTNFNHRHCFFKYRNRDCLTRGVILNKQHIMYKVTLKYNNCNIFFLMLLYLKVILSSAWYGQRTWNYYLFIIIIYSFPSTRYGKGQDNFPWRGQSLVQLCNYKLNVISLMIDISSAAVNALMLLR